MPDCNSNTTKARGSPLKTNSTQQNF